MYASSSGCYQQPLEVCFMLDSSTSLNSAAMFYKELGFVAGLSQRFDIGEQNTRFSVISFSDDSVLNVKLTDSVSKKALQQKVLNIDYMTGDTYTDKAVNLMLSEGFEGARPNIPRIGVVITDGKATDPPTLEKVLKKVKKAGIKMIAIGVGGEIDVDQLNTIAGDKDHVFPVLEGVGALKFIEDNLIKTVCNAAQAYMSYTMPFPK
ncbi:hypothetical protein FSP39_000836 [Pinctada imbricata]|uniref:VWFA domain-containing protein n=1 Tax=Pinctada imbricata TaxID=66713 RepID=A0AA88XE63_PINIB|nr:hypothetical protein FSP39_000836 [Pinctada imbricata]